MSSKLTLTIKDFPARGGSIRFKITSANIGETITGTVRVPKLIVTRKPDSYSPRFWTMAGLRRTEPNHQYLWLPQLTITHDKYDGNGKFFSSTMIDFFDAVVDDAVPVGYEEKITFLADRKSGEFTISNIEVRFD